MTNESIARQRKSISKTYMRKKNVGIDFTLKKIDKITDYLLEETKYNNFTSISKNAKKVCRALNCFEYSLIFFSALSGYGSTTAFALLVYFPVGIFSSIVASTIIQDLKGMTQLSRKKET